MESKARIYGEIQNHKSPRSLPGYTVRVMTAGVEDTDGRFWATGTEYVVVSSGVDNAAGDRYTDVTILEPVEVAQLREQMIAAQRAESRGEVAHAAVVAAQHAYESARLPAEQSYGVVYDREYANYPDLDEAGPFDSLEAARHSIDFRLIEKFGGAVIVSGYEPSDGADISTGAGFVVEVIR